MMVLDASMVIAHLSSVDSHHQAATTTILEARPGTMLIHTLTLAEVLVGGVKVGRGAAMQADIKAAGIQTALMGADEALLLAEIRLSSGLKLPDCCPLALAIQTGASLATFDNAVAAAARRRGVAIQP